MDVMDARRRMMEAGFPGNYLFREGKGFRKDISCYIYDENDASGFFDEDSIYIAGGTNYHGGIILAHGISWEKWATNASYKLNSESLDLGGYSALYVDAKCYSTFAQTHSIGIIDESKNGTSALQKDNLFYFPLVECSIGWTFYDTTEQRQIYALDISGIDIGTIIIKTGNTSSMYMEIYNIWME